VLGTVRAAWMRSERRTKVQARGGLLAVPVVVRAVDHRTVAATSVVFDRGDPDRGACTTGNASGGDIITDQTFDGLTACCAGSWDLARRHGPPG
jgi:hypothetical protein